MVVLSTRIVLRPAFTSIGATSSERRHAFHASAARCCDDSAYASCSAREMPYFAATWSDVCAM